MMRPLARQLLGLPRRRCASWLEEQWVPMHDGVRLATLHLWPLDVDEAPTILIRTANGRGGPRGRRLRQARMLAESGYHVLVQDVRGRNDSEGDFRPYESELRDGACSLEWAAAQSWCDGRMGLLGRGYSGFAAWAALAGAPERVAAMAVAACTRDVYAAYHPGGALALETALSWAVGIGDRTRVSPRSVDLVRGLAFRPAREADRVALRRIDWYRDWVDHPRRDEFWQALVPPLPEPAPPILLWACWQDPFLAAALADYERLNLPGKQSQAAHCLVIGPRSPASARWRLWHSARCDSPLREAIAYFDRHLRMSAVGGEAPDRVRYFVSGAGVLRSSPLWPPPEVQVRALHLRSPNDGPGLCFEAPGSAESADGLRHDPQHTPVEISGVSHRRVGDAFPVRSSRAVSDAVTYLSAPLERALSIAGNVRAEIFVSSSAPDADFAARVVDVRADGAAFEVCDGIARCRWRGLQDEDREPRFLQSGEVVELAIDLGPAAHRFAPGQRIGLEITSCGHPRFDCNPGRFDDPASVRPSADDGALQQVFHDPARPSRLLLPVLEAP